MRRVLLSGLCRLMCLAGVPPAAASHPPQSATDASPSPADAAYEADEAAMLRSLAGRAQRLAGGQPVCVNLHLPGQSRNAATGALRSARTARQARSAGFDRIERALALRGGRAAAADRDLDAGEIAGVEGVGRPSLVERCPAPIVFTALRPVRAENAALLEVSVGSGCSSSLLFIAMRKRGRDWRIEGEYLHTVPGGLGCGVAYPGGERAPGRYLLVGG